MLNIKQNLEYKQKLANFLVGKSYMPWLEYEIRKYFISELKHLNRSTDVYYQIFSALDLLEEEKDLYKCYLKKLKEYFTIEQNILEIGCGCFPALARLIDMEQTSLNKGTITAYDPYLSTTNVGNIILFKRKIDKEDLSDFDLLISTLACESADIALEKSYEYKKPLFLGICECSESKDQVYQKAKRFLDSGAEIEMDEFKIAEHNRTYPILIKRYKN